MKKGDFDDMIKGTSGAKIDKTLKTGAYASNAKYTGNRLGEFNDLDINVSQKGLDIVKNHIDKFDEYAPNKEMLNRIEKALANGEKLTGADASFYMYELAGSTIMKDLTKPMNYDDAYDIAHLESLKNMTYHHFQYIIKILSRTLHRSSQ